MSKDKKQVFIIQFQLKTKRYQELSKINSDKIFTTFVLN